MNAITPSTPIAARGKYALATAPTAAYVSANGTSTQDARKSVAASSGLPDAAAVSAATAEPSATSSTVPISATAARSAITAQRGTGALSTAVRMPSLSSDAQPATRWIANPASSSWAKPNQYATMNALYTSPPEPRVRNSRTPATPPRLSTMPCALPTRNTAKAAVATAQMARTPRCLYSSAATGQDSSGDGATSRTAVWRGVRWNNAPRTSRRANASADSAPATRISATVSSMPATSTWPPGAMLSVASYHLNGETQDSPSNEELFRARTSGTYAATT